MFNIVQQCVDSDAFWQQLDVVRMVIALAEDARRWGTGCACHEDRPLLRGCY